MAFTFSHPAAVLPLLRGLRGRGPLLASALVAGSIAPDLPFFAESWLPGVHRYGRLTHRWWAIPTLDVALTGLLVAGWQGAVRRPLLALLPEPWAVAFALSAAIGAAGHVGWDAFTHQGRAGVRLLPALNREVAGVPGYTVLQYGTSAVALAVLGCHLARELPRVAAPGTGANPPGRQAGRVVVGLAAAVGAARRLTRAARVRGPGAPRDPIADLCFGAGAGAVTGALGLAVRARWGRDGCRVPTGGRRQRSWRRASA
ncbi:DUF4184 family protein [Kitasatospora sp. NPDC052896]|uniref:DUF4184 family protein n=1 Tax=Kitasatospora sp. NPDC052896 TaxID=3364061 RepID=UPI0037CB8C44